MSLARTYATVFQELSQTNSSSRLDGMLAYMKKKGHLSVLPQMLRIVEREQKENATVHITVARESDITKYQKDIDEVVRTLGGTESPRVSIDPNVVGGFSVRSGSHLVDTTIRSSLVNIYQNAIS